jgi:hypothetical protein
MMIRPFVFNLILFFSGAVGVLVIVLLVNWRSPEPTATPDPMVQMIEGEVVARMTERYVEQEQIKQYAQATATQMVYSVTATAQSAQSTQQTWVVTVQADQAKDTATAQAQATATQQAVIGMTATLQAEGTATAAYGTQQAPFVAAQATAVSAQAVDATLKLATNQAQWWWWTYGMPLVFIGVIGALMFFLWKNSQFGTVPTDDNGRPQIMVVEIGGKKTIISPSLMGAPVIELGRDGSRMPLMLPNYEMQERITHGAQVVEGIKSLPPGYQRQALGMAAGMTQQAGGSPQINIQVVQPNQISPVLDEVEGGLLED